MTALLAEVPRVVLSAEHVGYTWAGSEDLPALARGEGGVAILAGTLRAMALVLRGVAASPG